MSGVKQDLTDHRGDTLKVEGPEAAFLQMLEDEQGGRTPEPAPDPKPDSGEEPEEGEEELEEETVPAEEESDDPAKPESDDLPEQDEGTPETEPVFDVVVNGETLQVSHEELLKGYSREADYTQRTQEVADIEREFVADREAIHAERGTYDSTLGQLQEIIEQSLPQEPDWSKLKTEAPEQFPIAYAEWTQRKEQLGKVKAERQRVQDLERADQQKALARGIETERVKLQRALPDLFDTDKGQTLGADMLQTAESFGYTPEEVSAVLDSRALRLLHDATQYRLLKQKGKIVKTRAKRTPTVKPGAAAKPKPARSRVRDAETRLRKSGSVEDAAALFLEDMTVKKRA